MKKHAVSFAIALGLLGLGVMAPACTEIPESRDNYGTSTVGDGGNSSGSGGRGSGGRGQGDGGPGAGGRGTGGRGAGGGSGTCDPEACGTVSVPGLALPACCGGTNADECGYNLADLGIDACVPADNPGGPSPDCSDRVVGGETLAGCCRAGSATCGLTLSPPGLELGCVDPVVLGLPVGAPCTPVDDCPPPGAPRGDPCTENVDCCGGEGVAACVGFGDSQRCTKYCTLNTECESGCCAPLLNGKGSCDFDGSYCTAPPACREVEESCDFDGDCCSGACVAQNENFGPRICRPACSNGIPCVTGQCLSDNVTGSEACIEDTLILCTDSCIYANDAECDEERGLCTYGTDCSDCGLHTGGQGTCDDTCGSTNNQCEDGGSGAVNASCGWGTDCTDCGPRLSICANTCQWAQDGECDEPTGACAEGTDCWDCGFFYGGRGQVPCDGTTAGKCTIKDSVDYNTVGACDNCPDCAWDHADCSAPDLCDGRSVSACCSPTNPCGIDGDGYCDCGGFCSWEATDCSPDGVPVSRCDPASSFGCDSCVQNFCCAEWTACDATCMNSFLCLASCLGGGQAGDACTSACTPQGGSIAVEAANLLTCAYGPGGTEVLCPDCFSGGVTPGPQR